MTQRRQPFLGWPGWDRLGYFALLIFVQTLWFGLIYGGAEILTAHRTLRLRLHLKVEQELPFVPAAILVYTSIFILFYASPFILRTRRELRALAITLGLTTLCAGICFLLFPAELGFSIPRDLGVCAPVFRLADGLNLDYNLVPSLHAAMSVVCIAAFGTRAGATGKLVLWAWAMAIGASAIVTYQHHVLDVMTGFILGIVAIRLVYHRLCTSGLDDS